MKSLCVVVTLFLFAGCFVPQRFGDFTHEKFGWNAEDYFVDKDVCSLCDAIQKNDLISMKEIIDGGVNVDERGINGMTPLMWAYAENILEPHGDPEPFRMLLAAGANPGVIVHSEFNSKFNIRIGTTVAHMAARSMNSSYFSAILKNGIDPNLEAASRRPSSKESLFDAVLSGSSERKSDHVEQLLSLKPNQSMLDRSVQEAINCDEFGIAMKLFKAGASARTYTDWGNMVHLVANRENGSKSNAERKKDYLELVHWLVDHGEDFEGAKKDVERWNKHLASVVDPSIAGTIRKNELRHRAATELNPQFSKDLWRK